MLMIKFVIFTTTTLDGLSLLPRCWRLPLGALKVSASAEGRFDFVPSFREVQILEDVSEGPFLIYFRFSVVMSLTGEIDGGFSASPLTNLVLLNVNLLFLYTIYNFINASFQWLWCLETNDQYINLDQSRLYTPLAIPLGVGPPPSANCQRNLHHAV